MIICALNRRNTDELGEKNKQTRTPHTIYLLFFIVDVKLSHSKVFSFHCVPLTYLIACRMCGYVVAIAIAVVVVVFFSA